MKIFVPMSDDVLGDNGEVCQRLVPFNLAFINENQAEREGRKPSNWVSESNYEQARQRLFAAQA